MELPKQTESAGVPLDVLQAAFYVHIMGQKTDSPFESHIHPDEIGSGPRAQIHKNNFFITLADALRQVYPVLNRLVGEEYFDHVARDYVCSNPPKGGCLVDFGEDFPSFMAARSEVRNLVYLEDVGRFEWLLNESFHEEDAVSVAPTVFEEFVEESYGDLRFQFLPSSRLFYSPYPVHKIWQTNLQDESPKQVSLDEGPSWSLIVRPEMEVEVRHLHKADYKFLNALKKNKKLVSAIEDAQNTGEDFNPQRVLVDFLDVFKEVKL